IAACGAVETFEGALAERLAAADLSPAVRSALAAESHNLGEVAVPASATPTERRALEEAPARAAGHRASRGTGAGHELPLDERPRRAPGSRRGAGCGAPHRARPVPRA